MQKIRRGFCVFILLFSFIFLSHSQETTLYTLKNAPQSLRVNTSYFPKYKWFISIPGISGINVGVSNSAFSMNDLFPSNTDGSLHLGLDSIADVMSKRAVFHFNTSIELLNIGVRIDRKKFMYLNVQDVIDVQFAYSKDLLSLAAFGNGHDKNLGRELKIDRLGAKVNHYTKIGFGWLFPNRKGNYYTFRPNLLFGKGYLNTQGSYLNLTTDENLGYIHAKGDLDIKMSGLPNLLAKDQEIFNIENYATNFFKNVGISFDFGIQKQISKTQSINFNLLDLGGIVWSEKVNTINTSGIDIKLIGIDINAFAGDPEEKDTNQVGFVDSLLITLDSQLNLVTGHAPFFAPTSPKIYLGTTFFVNEWMDFDIFFRAQLKSSYFHQSITLSPNFHTKTGLGLSISYSVIGNSFDNIGFGFTWNAGPIQIYFVGDNVYGFSQLDYSKHMNILLGFNIMPQGRRYGAFQKKSKNTYGGY